MKLAEDGSGDVVVRLYESLGSRSFGVVLPSFGYREVQRTDLLERRIEPDVTTSDAGAVALAVRPFEIVTLRFRGVRRG